MRNSLVIFLCLFVSVNLLGQIRDDSTKQLFSSKTTYYYQEQDIYFNDTIKYSLDTALTGLHDYYYINQPSWLYQDLGNLATPTKALFYQPQPFLGRRLGINVYDIFAFDPARMRYYDTRSPYTSLNYVQGSLGQQLLDVIFSRNINRFWNAGVEFRRLSSHRQLGFPPPRSLQGSHFSFAFFTRYFSKSGKYQILFNATNLKQTNFENGGIYPNTGDTQDSLFDYAQERVRLDYAESLERRRNFHLYHHFSPTGTGVFQIFHQADYQQRVERFKDSILANTFYPTKRFDTVKTKEQINYDHIINKAGIKGRAGAFFYALYVKNRIFHYSQSYNTGRRSFTENYAGGDLRLKISDTINVTAHAEYLIGRDYEASVTFNHKYFQVFGIRQYYSPSLVQNYYSGNIFVWSNDFKNTTADYIIGKILLRKNKMYFNPFASLTNLNNYIYYNESALPEQAGSNVSIFSAGFSGRFNFHALYLDEDLIYNKRSGPDVFRIPELMSRTRLFLQGRVFNKALFAQLGIEMRYRSSFYADNYMPVTMQFYLNNSFIVNQYPLIDAFVNMQIKTANIFFRMSNVNQGLPKNGYFTTPYYTGLKRSFDFGITWRFYD